MGLLLAVLAGCASLPAHISAELESPRYAAEDPYAARAPSVKALALTSPGARGPWSPPAESSLKSGQLLVWGKRDAGALFVGLFAQEFRPWSHIGIVSVEADGVYVFETNSAFLSSSDAPPTESATGGMRHLRFKEHVSADYVFGVFDPPPAVNKTKMVDFARRQFERGARFDAFFDSQDHEKLYCSELIALALEAGGATPTRLTPVRQNRSYDVLRRWLNIHSAGFYLPADFTAPERQVALWSRDLSPAQIEALFSAQRELALRFGPDTPLGQLMQWNAFTTSMLTALSLREAPQRFIDTAVAAWAHDTSPSPDRQAIRRQVQQLAIGYFLQPLPSVEARH
ncbi:MAG: hypothetical protein WEK74_04320 [Hydrogenophaga sp.]